MPEKNALPPVRSTAVPEVFTVPTIEQLAGKIVIGEIEVERMLGFIEKPQLQPSPATTVAWVPRTDRAESIAYKTIVFKLETFRFRLGMESKKYSEVDIYLSTDLMGHLHNGARRVAIEKLVNEKSAWLFTYGKRCER